MCNESELILNRSNMYDLSEDLFCSDETFDSINFLDEIIKQSSIVDETWRSSTTVEPTSNLNTNNLNSSTNEIIDPQSVMVLQEVATPQDSALDHQNMLQYYNEPKDYDLGASYIENIDNTQYFAPPEKVFQNETHQKDETNNNNNNIINNDNNNNEEKFICDHCNKVCLNRHSLQKHMIVHTDPQFSCQVCGKRYKRSENLNAHIRSHSQPTLTCNKCNASFKYHASYHYHIKHVQ